MSRCRPLCGTVVVLSLAVLLSAATPCTSAHDVLQTSVLIQFDDAAFKAAVASARQEAAIASISRNTERVANQHRPRVAAAAAGIPAAASLANSIVNTARASRIRIRRYQSYGMVFDGMALEAETPAEADALRGWLKHNPKVKNIYPVVRPLSFANLMNSSNQLDEQQQPTATYIPRRQASRCPGSYWLLINCSTVIAVSFCSTWWNCLRMYRLPGQRSL